MEVHSNVYRADIEDYGNTVTLKDPRLRVSSRKLVLEGRANPGYRIDYEGPSEGGKDIRGALLLTLRGETAIWLNIQSESSDWTGLEPTVERIMLRFGVAR